jgi:hypothetical protein
MLAKQVVQPGDSGESIAYHVSLAFPKLSYQDVSLPMPIGLVSEFGNIECICDDCVTDEMEPFMAPIF